MKTISSGQLKGEFNGFKDDKTIFEFMNGQKWRQIEYRYHYHYAYMPKAKILYDNGRYFLEVNGLSQLVQVMRVS